MNKKIEIEKDTIMETLVMPLYGRAICSEKYPDSFQDPGAEEVIKKIDYDFSGLKYPQHTIVVWAMRKRFMCDRIKLYLREHPNATIVNLGCGTDEIFSLIDNGSCRLINLDLPDVIEARRKLMDLREREKNVEMDAFNTRWFEEVETRPEDGLFVISGGMLMYFTEEKIRPLFCELAKRFPDGGICFDAENQKGLDKSNKVIRKSGNNDAFVVFAVDDAEKLFLPWSDNFKKVMTFNRLPAYVKKAKNIPRFTRMMIGTAMKMGFIKFVEIRF